MGYIFIFIVIGITRVNMYLQLDPLSWFPVNPSLHLVPITVCLAKKQYRSTLQSLVWPWFDLTVARIYAICFAVFGLTLTVARIYTICFAVFGLTLPWLESIRYSLQSLVWPYRGSNLYDMFCRLWFDPYRGSNLYDMFCSLWFDLTVARIYTICFAVFGLTLSWLKFIRYVSHWLFVR
jgi:hypothetical protein